MGRVPLAMTPIMPRTEDLERTEQWEATRIASQPWITASKIQGGSITAARIRGFGDDIEVTTHSDPTRVFVGSSHSSYRPCAYCRRIHDQESCPGCGAPLRN